MTAMRRTARRLLADETGAAAIEYALLAALIAGVIIGAAISVGQTLQGIYSNANTELVNHMPSAPSS